MSSATYFTIGGRPGVWLTHHPAIRRLLRKHGWQRIPYADAMQRLGGKKSARFAIARCSGGYIEHRPSAAAQCGLEGGT